MDFRRDLKQSIKPQKGTGLIDYFSQYPNYKEEMMKRLIYLTVVLMIGFICFGCSGMSPEQRKESYDLRSSVGNQPFVGATSPGARDLAWFQMYGP